MICSVVKLGGYLQRGAWWVCVCVICRMEMCTQGHTPGIQETGAQDHNGLTGALFELHLNGAELAVDDVHHALDLFGRNWPCA